MKSFNIIITLLLFCLCTFKVKGQTDSQPPVSPVLELVSVQPVTGYSYLKWRKSTSPDVAGYVIYTYTNNEGYAVDTIRDPMAGTFIFTGSAAGYYSESYVVAAIDSSYNISPLSNEIPTIFVVEDVDTCTRKIELIWNLYPSVPFEVKEYLITVSVSGSPFSEIARTNSVTNRLVIDNIETGRNYCFNIKAVLDNGLYSESNTRCVETEMQRTPSWINADYATVTEENKINISFTADPLSELSTYILERKEGLTGSFIVIAEINTFSNPFVFTDNSNEAGKEYYYKLSGVNNCGTVVISSNIAGIIIPHLELSENEYVLNWNSYRNWNGQTGSYTIYINNTGDFEVYDMTFRSDTTISIPLKEIMYNTTNDEICFLIKASETLNPYGINGESRSQVVCSDIIELISVPNAFTPNNDLINDLFLPVLSFTPKDYRLIIRDRNGLIMFDTTNPLDAWDGNYNGTSLPPEVYLWYLNISAPSGKSYTRTGNVTIIYK